MNHSRKIALLSVTEGRGHGAEVVLMEMLRGWNVPEWEPVIIAPAGSEVYAVAEECGLETLVFPSGRDAIVPNLRAAWQLRRQVSGMAGIHGWTARTLECVVAMRSSAQQRIWATLHDHPRAEFHGSLRRWVIKNAASRLQALVTVSQAVAGECQSAGFKVPTHVIHNGLNQPDWA
ncbi:MAG: glycosyltransferase, partial [Verrucomicrobia bacterium]|nr:glycosyltransferase [Verrucomicrobiota bacterium]